MNILYPTLNVFLHYLLKVKIGIAANLNGILHVRPENSSCEI